MEAGQLYAVTKTSSASGNWGADATWSPSGVPSVSDDVIISSGHVVTVNGNYTCNNLTIGTNSAFDASVIITVSTNSLAINGDLQLNPHNKAKNYILDAGPGSISISGTLSVWGTSGTNKLMIGAGTMTISPAISITNIAQKIEFTGAGTLNFNAGFSDARNSLTTFSGCTVNFASYYRIVTTAATWAGKGRANFANGTSISSKAALTLNDVYINANSLDTILAGAGTLVIGGSLTLSSGATLLVQKNFELQGNWINNGGTLSTSGQTITLNGPSNTIGGTSSTTFPTLRVGKSAGTTAVSYTMNNSNTCSYLIIDGGAYNRTLSLGSSVILTVSNDVTINQPSASSLNSSLMVNDGTCNISGDLIFSGTDNTTTKVARVAVTSGQLTVADSVAWMNNSESATEVITVTAGTINFTKSLTMGSNSGTLSVTDAGIINFNGISAPSFNFGGASVAPVFSTAAGSTINFTNGFTNNTNALSFSPLSTASFVSSGTVTPNAAITFGHIVIASGATMTLAGNISLAGNWTNNGGVFTPAGYAVSFSASGPNTQTIAKTGVETFHTITAANTGATIILANDVTVTNALNMDGANINMNDQTLTIGNGSGASLSRSAGIAYGGTWKRWLPATAITSGSGSYYGLLPIGTAFEYRPVEINTTSSPSSAGYIMASHYDTTSITLVDYTDNESDDIEDISDITTTITTSGLDGGAYNIDVSFTGLSNKGVTSDLKLLTYTAEVMGSVGTSATTTGTVVDPTVKRTGLSVSEIQNVWVIGSMQKNITPIREFYYSRKTGNWDDATVGDGTWSRVSGGSGISCDCIPESGGCIVIEAGHTVSVNINASIDYVDINDGGTLEGGNGKTFTVNRDFTEHGTGNFTNNGTWIFNRRAFITSSSSSSGDLSVFGALDIASGSTYTQTSSSFNVYGNLNLEGEVSLNSASMNLSGNGTSISGTGTITSTSSGDSINVTNDKTILSGSDITIGSGINEITVTLNGEMDLTNNGTIKMFGSIEGNDSLSSWVNEANSSLEITGSLLNTGSLITNASPNTVNYNGNGARTIKAPSNNSYYNLLVSNAGAKTLDSDIAVTNALTIQDAAILDEGTFAITGNASLTMSGTSELKLERSSGGTYPELTGLYSITGGTITLNQTSDTAILKSADYFNLKFTGSQPYDISAISSIDNNFDIQGSSSLINTTNLTVTGELNYASSGSSTLGGNLTTNGIFISNGTFQDGGHTITVNGTGGWNLDGGTFMSTGVTAFTGGSAQEIGGSLSTTFNILRINNTGGVTLNVTPADATILSNSLILTSGILHTSSGNPIRLLDNATSGMGSSSSYVDGPMTKVGNDDFIFPLGKSGRWRRAAISAISDSTTEVTAEYFAGPYANLTPISDSLTQISDIEYWDIDRTVTSDSLKLRLFWENATASDIINCDYLTIAHWKSGQWEKEASVVAGGSSCTGSGSGSIETEGWISSFSPFSFGGAGGQALPVTLVSFDAFPEGEIVKTQWVTELEINNNYFVVERSADAVNFSEVVRVMGAGNSTEVNNYEATDFHPLSGVSYYRLRQVDFDGQYAYSKIVSVKRAEQSSLSLYPNPTDNELSLSVTNPSGDISVVIYDLAGREMYAQVFKSDNYSNPQTVTINAKYLLPTGIYMITAFTNGKTFREKVILR